MAETKKQKAIREKITPGKVYSIDEVLELVQSLPGAEFKKTKESVDVAINLGVDPRKSDQVVRGASVLPNGTGREVRVAVFAQGQNVDLATNAGADKVGFEDLAEAIKGGQIDFDILIATPDAMRLVGQLGQILGPKGLMPNPKVGTVTTDVATAVKNAKGGQVQYRTDKAGIIHCSIGKVDFTVDALKENLEALVVDLKRYKPSTSKGTYLKKLTISTTMGPGLLVDLSSLNIK
ncbi:MAG: 50S ribosomal protein L1 [Gammaproteobacteria bacterium]|nr:50S ribosomal protein L1 [Gammaproteobacteria bacterium]